MVDEMRKHSGLIVIAVLTLCLISGCAAPSADDGRAFKPNEVEVDGFSSSAMGR